MTIRLRPARTGTRLRRGLVLPGIAWLGLACGSASGQSTPAEPPITPDAGQPPVVRDSVKLTRPAVLKTNILGPFSFFVEVPTAPKQSIQLSAQAVSVTFFNKTSFFSLTLDYRFYLSKLVPSVRRPAPNGFYVAPYLKFRTVTHESIGLFSGTLNSTDAYTLLGGGVVAGAQLIRRKGFTVDAFLGTGYFPFVSATLTKNSPSSSLPESSPQQYQLDIRPGLCFGLAL